MTSSASSKSKSTSKTASAGRAKTRTSRSKSAGQRASEEAGTVDREADAAAREALLASDKLYYRIGEVSGLTGVKAHVLRYWETEFRWMAPPKSRSKQRLYRKRDIEFVWLLKRLLWEERYTIAGARQRIQDLGIERALGLLSTEDSTEDLAGAAVDHGAQSQADAAPSPKQWVSFRSALDQLRGELVDLRDVLQ